jgi:hypothetical protein
MLYPSELQPLTLSYYIFQPRFLTAVFPQFSVLVPVCTQIVYPTSPQKGNYSHISPPATH